MGGDVLLGGLKRYIFRVEGMDTYGWTPYFFNQVLLPKQRQPQKDNHKQRNIQITQQWQPQQRQP